MDLAKALLPVQLIHQCRRRGKGLKAADSTGARLSGFDLLIRTLVLKRIFSKHVIQPNEQNVAILLPPGVPAVIANFALCFLGKTAINLNYSASAAILNSCIRVAEVKHVLTSRRVTEKLNIELNANVVYLEDLKDKATLFDKVLACIDSRILPANWLIRKLGLNKIKPTDPLTIVFTSGSTGTPKGVVLSYENINSNVQAVNDALSLKETDVLIGILPFFHSFGYTVALWAAQALDMAGVYHYSPLDARQIAGLAVDYKATILLATPTFLRNYMRRVEPEQFKSLEMVVVGAEKLPQSLSDAFEQRFGLRPIEGYGLTEMSPLVSVNLPPLRTKTTDDTRGLREGSVGRPLPGVRARIVNPDTGEVLRASETGMLEVTGPSMMQGYLDRPDLTSTVIRDGWYVTGDMAFIDSEGYIFITGRQSRFSKIGGEMVPHIQIEESILEAIGTDHDGEMPAVVTAVPDEKRGERLVVLHLPIAKTPSEILKHLTNSGLPNLYLPSEDSFIQIDKIPVLGSGKLDLKGIHQLAVEKTAFEKIVIEKTSA